MSETLTLEFFKELQGENFSVDDVPGAPVLRLDEVVEPAARNWPDDLPRPFTVMFEGPRNPVVAEGQYRLRADSGRTAGVYLVPVFTSGASQRYQVVFC